MLSDEGARWSYDGLGGFLRLFGWSTRLLRSPEAYTAVLDDLLVSLDEQGLQRAEVFLAFGQMHRVGVEPGPIVRRLAERAHERESEGGCSVHFVADATRNWGVAAAERVLDAALDLRGHRVVGFGMGGEEASLRAREFRRVYRRAAEHGLPTSCHAGEGTHPDAVREVVEELEVRRVGHGIAAVEDPALLRELRDAGITLEVCPTSNECTGAWNPKSGDHPVLRLVEHGVDVVIGSDDPAFFGTTVTQEFARLSEWGLSDEQLRDIDAHARRVAWASGQGTR